MTTQVLRGKVEALALVDVLAYLGRNSESGILNVTRDDVKKSIVINEGNIIFARSNQVEDRLGDILLAQGVITQEQYNEGSRLIYEKGYRHGRALIEIGAISPKVMWHTIRGQIHGIACSVIPWEHGSFEFFKQDIKKKESITLQLPILEMVLDVVRNLDNRSLFKTRFGDMREVYAVDPGSAHMDAHLEPHEKHLLHFIDGQRTIYQICEQGDYGEAESLRVLYLLRLLGRIITATAPVEDVATHPLVANFNRVFRFLYNYLAERVGTVGTNLLKKYFEDVRKTQPIIFNGVSVLADGQLNPVQLQKNLGLVESDQVEMLLDEAMNEYLNMSILAVKKVLGTEHEEAVIREIANLG